MNLMSSPSFPFPRASGMCMHKSWLYTLDVTHVTVRHMQNCNSVREAGFKQAVLVAIPCAALLTCPWPPEPLRTVLLLIPYAFYIRRKQSSLSFPEAKTQATLISIQETRDGFFQAASTGSVYAIKSLLQCLSQVSGLHKGSRQERGRKDTVTFIFWTSLKPYSKLFRQTE